MFKKMLFAVVVATLVIPGATIANPGARMDLALPNSSDLYEHYFAISDAVVIQVRGDGDADLDLIVRDPLGRKVAEDVSPATNAQVSFVPLMSGRYTIEVKNCGSEASAYLLVLNHRPLGSD